MTRRVLMAGIALPVLLWLVSPVGTGAQPPLSSVQGKIQSTRGRIGAKKGTERVLTTQISAFNRRIESLQGSIGTLTGRVSSLQSDLAAQRSELVRLQSALRSERARVLRLRGRLAFSRRTLATRLVALYESDRPDLVTVILNSKGFADLIERQELIRRISDQDQQIIDGVTAARRDATAAAARLAGLEARQRRATALVLARRDAIARTRSQLVGTRTGFEQARGQRASALASTRSQRRVLEGRLSDLRAEEAKIRAALSTASRGPVPAAPVRGGGRLIWPVNGPITSPFCERRSWEACHPGIDISVPGGTPVRAAGAGTVALEQSTGASGGYGNFLCIQHSASLSSCYAHLGGFSVGMGARVAQGQVVATSGCSGRCFGDHLHFEVRVNGAVTNPLNFL